MKAKKVVTIIKGMTYTLPTYSITDKGHQEVDGHLSLKFCNERNGLKQIGVAPNHLLAAVSKFVEEEDYAHKQDIVEALESVASLIDVARRAKAKEKLYGSN